MHGDVVQQFLEVVGAGNEVALAVDLHQHPDLPARVDVVRYCPFTRHARGFLGRNRHPLFSQQDNRVLQVPLGLGQGMLAVHHGCPGLFPELFHLCSRNVCHSRAHQKPLYKF